MTKSRAVTKMVPEYESFSEEEIVPQKAKPVAAPALPKPKKGGKPGQGSITNFFLKK
jgi:hypothetical protein